MDGAGRSLSLISEQQTWSDFEGVVRAIEQINLIFSITVKGCAN